MSYLRVFVDQKRENPRVFSLLSWAAAVRADERLLLVILAAPGVGAVRISARLLA